MEGIEWTYLLPLLILAAAPVATLLGIALKRDQRMVFGMSLFFIVLAFAACLQVAVKNGLPYSASDMLVVDAFGLFYTGLLLGAAFFVLLFSRPYLADKEGIREEYYVLFQCAVLGAAVLCASTNFATLFLGLEVLSVSLYGLIAYLKRRRHSIEAGFKYLILAAGSSAFLLFGIALIYAESGSLSFDQIGTALQDSIVAMAGLALVIAGIGFKLAVVPFHLWTPDVYQGAPTPVTAFIASVSKGSVLAVLLRFAFESAAFDSEWTFTALSAIAIASMLLGNLLALQQKNLKRLLAYSSIAHLGYILIAFIAHNELTGTSVSFYLAAYFIAILGSFGTLSLLASGRTDLEQIGHLKGLFYSRPLLSIFFCIFFFSLVGLPLTAGFIGKYLLVLSALASDLWALAIALVISSAIGLYYYLRVIKTMLTPLSAMERDVGESPGTAGLAILGTLALAALLLGVYPAPLLQLLSSINFGL